MLRHTSYLSFLLHEQNFWRIKFTPKKRVNYGKIHRKLPNFRIKSERIYTGQKNSTMRCEAVKKSDMLVVIFRSDNIKVCSFTCLPMLLEVLSFSSQRPLYGSQIGSTGNLGGGYVFVSVTSLSDHHRTEGQT